MRRGAPLLLVWLACLSLPAPASGAPTPRSSAGIRAQPRRLLQSEDALPISYADFSVPDMLSSISAFLDVQYLEPIAYSLELLPQHVSNLRDSTGAEVTIAPVLGQSTVTGQAHMRPQDVARINAAMVRPGAKLMIVTWCQACDYYLGLQHPGNPPQT